MQVQTARAALRVQTVTKPVKSNHVSVGLQFCYVRVDRPWLSTAFLNNRNWFIPGYEAGSLAVGGFDAGCSVPATAPLSALPTGFVAVQNLEIKGTWSSDDRQASNEAAGFGPFSLIDRKQSEDGMITCEGMQIVGWFCQALPTLPPASDPALPPNHDGISP
jgi:hypothetical protein